MATELSTEKTEQDGRPPKPEGIDALMARAHRGDTSCLPELRKLILGTSLTYYRCNPKHILPEHLDYYMRLHGFKTQYLQVMRQSTRNQVPITKQREFYHVIPPIEEQSRLIVALDGLFESGQQLAALYQRKLAALEALKKSLLHQAFSGEL
jgi:type I restriction enzyme, S subunit